MRYVHPLDPTISVVILTHNSGALIGRCLRSLLDLGLEGTEETVEILVIDSSTRDDTEAQVEALGVPVIRCSGNVSVKRNEGLRRARGDVAVFLDSDCFPHRGWLGKLVGGLCPQEKVVAVMGASVGERENVWSELEDKSYREGFLARIRRGGELIAMDTRNLALERRFALELGGFSEDQPSFEDMELGARIRGAGYRIRYEPGAVVTHKHRTTLRAKWRQAFWHSRGAYLYAVKHRRSPDPEIRAFAGSLRIPTILGAWLVSGLFLTVLGTAILLRAGPWWAVPVLGAAVLAPALFNPLRVLKLAAAGSPREAVYYLDVSTAQRLGVLWQFLAHRRPFTRGRTHVRQERD